MGEARADQHDAELARRAISDPEAFGLLYDRYVVAIYRYCLRRLGTKGDAEDATSQTFARALDGLAGFRGGSVRSWLFTIAHNVLVNDLRGQARLSVPLEDAADVVDRSPSPEAEALAAERDYEIRRILHVLPVDQRQAVELRLAGLTGAEVAHVLGKSVPAVKMLQLRAMKRLRQEICASRDLHLAPPEE